MSRKSTIVLVLVLVGTSALFYLLHLLKARSAISVTPPSPSAPVSTSSSSIVPSSSPIIISTLPVLMPPAPKTPASQGPRLKIGTLIVPVELARTSAEVQKGLSGRMALDMDKGMLFLFTKPDIYHFWMPDMHFPLDMIWISSDKKIIGISANASNEFDPANPRFYTPPSPAQYVLEVNAGFAAQNGIKVGSTASFIGI